MLLEGLHIPLTTPFQPDGRLNLPKLAANVARYSKSPASGLIVLGTQGEPTLLTDEETHEVLGAAAEAAAPEKVLLAGVSRDSVRATLALAGLAAELLYDAVLVGVPSIFTSDSQAAAESPTEGASVGEPPSGPSGAICLRNLLLYFQTIADRSPLPVVLFSDRDNHVPLDAAVELAAHPRILGLLDAAARPAEIEAILRRTASIKREVTVTAVFRAVTARMKIAAAATHAPASLVSADSLSAKQSADRAASATAVAETPPTPPLRTRSKSVGFQVLIGDTQAILESLRAGATGAAPAFAACAPQACYEVLAGWKDDDQPLAEEKQVRLCEAARLTEVGIGIGNLKFACDLNGYFGGRPRLPQLPPSGGQRAALEQLMKQLRN
jgi:dihydrodipicolinate synthase/N-acetylneuraminate lyase